MFVEFNSIVEKKTNQELEEYIFNIKAYRREIIEAVIVEMGKRGYSFSTEELEDIEIKMKEREETIGKSTITVREPWEKNLVTDVSCPQLYTKKVIDIFSIIFGALFASVLMAINFTKTEHKRGIIPVILFGLFFTVSQIIFFDYLNDNGLYSTWMTISSSFLAAIVLHYFFWYKYIGKDTKYRRKSFIIPLIMGLIITGLLIWFVFHNTI